MDEAQELSAMAWRMIMRRIPTRSMTIVGDVGQTGSPAGATSWGEMLDQYVAWREERLTVNYRTPEDVMDAAAEVLKEFAPDQEPPISVRPAEEPPRVVPIAGAGLNDVLRAEIDAAAQDLLADGEGRLAIITSPGRYAEVAALVPEAVTLDPLDAPVALMTVTTSKRARIRRRHRPVARRTGRPRPLCGDDQGDPPPGPDPRAGAAAAARRARQIRLLSL